MLDKEITNVFHVENISHLTWNYITKCSWNRKDQYPTSCIWTWLTLWEFTKFKCKICGKEIIGKKNFKVHMENVHKDLKKIQMWWLWQKFHTQYWIEGTYYRWSWKKRFNCDQCGKYFTRGCDLKVCIQIKLFIRKTLNWIVITVTIISPKSLIWKYMNHTKHWTEITAVYENKNFNCDKCGKYFAKVCNLIVLIQNVHEIYSSIELMKHNEIMIVILVKNHLLN